MGEKRMTVNVYIVRHGQTYLNLYHKMQGWADAPLTKSGINDGIEAGKALAKAGIKFDYAFSSDLARAVKTAQLALQQLPADACPSLHTDPNFREQFFGFLEGLPILDALKILNGNDHYQSFDDYMKDYPMAQICDKMHAMDPKGCAEDYTTFINRLKTGFAKLRSLPAGSNVLLVNHGIVLRTLMHRIDPEGKVYDFSSPDNGAITKLVLDGDQTKLIYFNKKQIAG